LAGRILPILVVQNCARLPERVQDSLENAAVRMWGLDNLSLDGVPSGQCGDHAGGNISENNYLRVVFLIEDRAKSALAAGDGFFRWLPVAPPSLPGKH
jgi:hypothetical protein